MALETTCPLCTNADIFVKGVKKDKRTYWDCNHCGLIFLDKEFHITSFAEKAHYLHHNNDISDLGYQKFVSPIIDYICKNIAPKALGLDYGAGPGPVVTSLLRKNHYEMQLYDPYFWNDLEVLKKNYDFIVASEVVEHFYFPAGEFQALKYLMRPEASLVIMTEPYKDTIDFETWYYAIDPTHVVFYRDRTFDWIRQNYGYESVEKVSPRVFVLKT